MTVKQAVGNLVEWRFASSGGHTDEDIENFLHRIRHTWPDLAELPEELRKEGRALQKADEGDFVQAVEAEIREWREADEEYRQYMESVMPMPV